MLRLSLFLPYLCPATFLLHVCNVTGFSRAACVELAQAGAATLLLWSFLLPKSLTVFLNFNNFRFVRFNPVCTEVGEITLNDMTILRTAMLGALVSVCLPRFCLLLIFLKCKLVSVQVSGYTQIDFRGSRIRCLLKITTFYFLWMIVF